MPSLLPSTVPPLRVSSSGHKLGSGVVLGLGLDLQFRVRVRVRARVGVRIRVRVRVRLFAFAWAQIATASDTLLGLKIPSALLCNASRALKASPRVAGSGQAALVRLGLALTNPRVKRSDWDGPGLCLEGGELLGGVPHIPEVETINTCT